MAVWQPAPTEVTQESLDGLVSKGIIISFEPIDGGWRIRLPGLELDLPRAVAEGFCFGAELVHHRLASLVADGALVVRE